MDEALPEAERTDVERHLDRCPPCRRSAVEEEGGRKLVRDCADRLRESELPPGLRSRCEALASDHRRAGAARPWITGLLPATVVAAVITVALVGVFSVATRRSGAVLAAQLTADHIKCFRLAPPSGEADAAQVERDLEAKYGWDIHVPPSSRENGVQLLGGFRCLYGEGTMPHVMYRTASAAPVSLFRLEGVTREEADLTTMGHRSRIWSRGGNTYVLVTPASTSGADARLVQYVRREAR